MIGRFFQRLLF